MPWQGGPALPQLLFLGSQSRSGGPKAQELKLHITRRQFHQGSVVTALSLALLGSTALPRFGAALADDDKVPMDDLMKPEALPDMVMGKADAPVTIIEYASMTCPHCAHFSETTFPELKKRYIDTGKVRFILRDFPLDNLAGAVFVLEHCIAKDDPEKYYTLVQTFFREQRTWAVEKPVPALMAIAKQAGVNEKDFNACLTNQKAWDAMEDVRQRALKEFKVDSTPTFFVNGTRITGAVPIEDFAKVIDPYLKGG